MKIASVVMDLAVADEMTAGGVIAEICGGIVNGTNIYAVEVASCFAGEEPACGVFADAKTNDAELMSEEVDAAKNRRAQNAKTGKNDGTKDGEVRIKRKYTRRAKGEEPKKQPVVVPKQVNGTTVRRETDDGHIEIRK